MESGGQRLPLDLAGLPAEFPRQGLVEPVPVEFPASDGMPIRGQLFLPSDVRAGERRPAVVFFHGGSRRQMLLGFHYLSYYHNAFAMNQYMASRGYVVLSVNYRSGVGYGLDFREALDYGARGASEFRDVLGAGPLFAGSGRCRSGRDRTLGWFLRRLSDGPRALSGLGPVCCRRGRTRGPRLEHRIRLR